MFGVWSGGCGVRARQSSSASRRAGTRRSKRPGPAALLDGRSARCRSPTPRRSTDEVAFVTWTSGTTGAPKPVLHTHANYLELLDRVLGPLRGYGRSAGDAPADAQSRPGLARAQRRHLQRAASGCGPGRRSSSWTASSRGEFADARARASRSGRRCCRRPRWRCSADDPDVVDLAPLRYVRSITAPAVAVAGAPLRRQVRRRRAERLRPGRDRRGDRVDGRRRARTSGQARGGRPSAPGCRDRDRPVGDEPGPGSVGSSCARPPPRSASTARTRRRRGLRRHRRPRAHRRRRIRLDRGPRRATSSTAAATRCSPNRSRRCCASSRGSRRRRWSGRPDERLGEVPVAFVIAGAGSVRRRSARGVPRAPHSVQDPGRVPPGRGAAA